MAATGLLGGRTGQFILDHLGRRDRERFFEIAGDTRNCIAILLKGKQTEILEKVQPFLRKGQDFLDHYRHLVEQVGGCCHLWKSSCWFTSGLLC